MFENSYLQESTRIPWSYILQNSLLTDFIISVSETEWQQKDFLLLLSYQHEVYNWF